MTNTLKEPKKKAKAAVPKKVNAVSRFVSDILDGTFLTGGNTLRNVPFALFLCVIAGLYIANTYNAERTVRATDTIGKDLKELQSEYISLKSELMFSSNQSQVAVLVAPLDLQESKEPPHKIYNKIASLKKN